MIDSHVHFYDPRRDAGLVWPLADSGMMESALPPDLSEAAIGLELKGVVAVEASRRFVDDEWLLDFAASDNLVHGVVLNLQPDRPVFATRFELAERSQFFRGVRLRPLVNYDLKNADLLDNISVLSDAGYSVEFGARTTAHKIAFADMAQQFPNGTWILDHCGHPDLGANKLSEEWLASMARIARRANVFVKVSNPYGMEPDPDPSRVEGACKAMIRSLNKLFGPERLMFGSNWPVSALSATYESVVHTLARSLENDGDRERFFDRNVRRAYRLAGQGG